MGPIIIYKTQTAAFNSVHEHLLKCDADFVPRLSEKTDITLYAEKIAENSVTFEAWIHEELVGLIAAYFNDVNGLSGFITSVSTLKKHAGKGIASALMKMCVDYAVSHQFAEILLEVFKENKAAIQLYKKHNFYQTEIKGDSIIMKKDLN
jgi:ribosomal protein S18 acetylase RimI-like enzyme